MTLHSQGAIAAPPATASAPSAYRREIDGLRAVAILAVVAFHAGLPGFGGGFVGVDVFFVISGFLITGMLVDDLATHGRIRLLHFYTRRIRRLLPALLVVIVATLVVAIATMMPTEIPRLGKSALAVVSIASNVHFLKYSGGYFDPSTDVMPLLHTWSLSVEEQYYLVWPLLLMAMTASLRRFRNIGIQRLAGALLMIVLAGSLAACLWYSYHDRPAAFYLTPLRAWEFALGGLACLGVRRSPPGVRLGGALVGIGLGTVMASVFLIDDSVVFPGIAALAPTIGATLILVGQASGAGYRSVPLRWLASGPMVRIGLLSYSWYLWHWPALALVRAYSLGVRDPLRDSLVIVIALVFAALSHRFIEVPIRYRQPWLFASARGTVVMGALLSVATLVLAAGAIEWGKYASAELDKRFANTADSPGSVLVPRQCKSGGAGQRPKILAWGDSHVGHLASLLDEYANASCNGFEMRHSGACPPLLGAVPYKQAEVQSVCARFNLEVGQALNDAAQRGIKGIILAARWNAYLSLSESNPAAITSYALGPVPPPGGEHAAAHLRVGIPPLDTDGSVATLERSLRQTVQTITGKGMRVLLVAPIPEMPVHVPQCLYRRAPEECTVSRSRVEARRQHTMAVFAKVAAEVPGVRVWDPIDQFCDAKTCYATRGGVVQYGDDNHISMRMSRRLSLVARDALDWLADGKR
jgi:peptidoglycan/LPS O-acetylase OafA/YrhL